MLKAATYAPSAKHKPLNPINRPNASTKEEVVVPGKPILRNVRPNNKRRPPTMKF